MLEPELCSNRGVLSPFREESGDEELSVLPRHTKVIVTGNNRTKSVLVGLQGVVKKAVGLGGWHWLVLKNGVEVKLQRNALSVLEHPTGNEVDEDHDFDSSSGSDIGEKDHDFSSSIEFHKLSKPRVRQTRPWVSSASAKLVNRGSYRDVQSIIHRSQPVNLARLGTDSLRRYCRHYNLANISSDSSREQMLNAVQRHFTSQPKLSEVHVISEFVNAVMKATKRRKPVDRHME
ncbi:SAP30 Sin3 bdg domain-containing protein [Citrus sinensis]|uniref:SAP30 Sin3 bdg domain-containing protein n=1 Tax=Citrus sinensis TaxID=2711 RepID=A0ACB8LPK4_CITSI|nr:SAP30 Sin3 bdg domain-containing protein [Citrus sinensis]